MDFISFIKETPLWLTIPLAIAYLATWCLVIWVVIRMFRKK